MQNTTRIHLCLIAGNEQDIIARCLQSFGPHVDSITVVRAIGNLRPDATLAEAVIFPDVPVFDGIYENDEGHDWPHVDNFAAARNSAFDLAKSYIEHHTSNISADWLMWADCDDLLSDEGAKLLAQLRRGAFPAADAIFSPYVTDAQGSYARRERLIRVRAYRGWINPVHELLQTDHITPERMMWSPQLKILHAPRTHKASSIQRNLRILEAIPLEQRTAREHWFLAREYELAGRITDAITSALEACSSGQLQPPEHYACQFILGRYLGRVDQAEKIFLDCARLAPHQREAWGALCELHLQRGDPQKALAYARILQSLPPDSSQPQWHHQKNLYGWKGRDLLALSLSAASEHLPSAICYSPSRATNGRTTDAAKAYREMNHEKFTLRISVAHPTCRPEVAIKIRDLWLERAAQPDRIEYIFGLNAGDVEQWKSNIENRNSNILHYPHAVSAQVPPGHSTAVANYNAAAAACRAKLIICAQDDIYPPHGWDDLIWAAMKPHLGDRKVLHVSDGFTQGQLMVIMCFTRKWLEHHGTLLSPEYDGYFSDTEYSHRCYQRGEVIDGRHIAFYHDHPAFTQKASDEAYYRQQNPEAVQRGRATFQQRNPAVKL